MYWAHLEVDVVNNKETDIGEEKQQHQGLLVRLLGQHLSHNHLKTFPR